MRTKFGRAVRLVWLGLLLAAAPALAQEAPPDPPGPAFPGAQEIADAVLRGLGGVLTATLDAWWDQSGPVVFGRLVAVAFGALVAWVWARRGAGPVARSTSSPASRRSGATSSPRWCSCASA